MRFSNENNANYVGLGFTVLRTLTLSSNVTSYFFYPAEFPGLLKVFLLFQISFSVV